MPDNPGPDYTAPEPPQPADPAWPQQYWDQPYDVQPVADYPWPDEQPVPPASPPAGYPGQQPPTPASGNPAQPYAVPPPAVDPTRVRPNPFTSTGPTYPPPGQPWTASPVTGPVLPGPTTPVAENVGRGLLFALLGVLAGFVLTIALWQVGFIASITTFVLAWASMRLYAKGAGAPPARGIPALIVLIVVGVVLCAIGVIASDAWRYLSEAIPDAPAGDLLNESIMAALDPGVWADYGVTLLMFFVFAGLGVFSTLRSLSVAARRRPQ